MKRLAALLALFVASTVSASFSGFTYEKVITISSTNVSNTLGTVVNFPVPFVSTDVVFSTASAGGHMTSNYDLVASSDPSCASQYWLNWDTETFNSGVAGSSFTAWVQLPVLTTATLTAATYYWCYGNSSITSYMGHSTATWDSNYKSVYHFNDNASSVGKLALDSTINRISQTYYQNSSGLPAPTNGQIDGASYFTSANENAGAASSGTAVSGTGTGSITIEGWLNLNSTHAYDSAYNNIVDMYDSSGLTDFSLSSASGDPLVVGHFAYFSGGFQNVYTSSGNISAGAWNQWAISYDNTVLSFYFNGVFTSSVTIGGHSRSGDVPLFLGFGPFTSRNSDFKFDEIRVSSSIRNADWIKTSYNSQHLPNTFSIAGAEQTASNAPFVNTNQVGLFINGGRLVVNGVQLIIQ